MTIASRARHQCVFVRLVQFLALAILLSATTPPATALDLAGPVGLPDPEQQIRAGLPSVPDPVRRFLDDTSGSFPFEPIDRDPTEGIRHGWVQTSNGRFGFRTVDLTLPARVPFRIGRVYDAGIWARLPLVPVGDEPRPAWDLGPNWGLMPSSVLMAGTGGTFVLVTDEGGLVTYVAAGGGKYKPSPDRPYRFGMMEPAGTNVFKVRLTDGLLRTYTKLSGQLHFWLTKEEDPSGNALNFVYVGGMLQRINASDGSWVEFKRPAWGASAPGWVRSTRVVQIVDSTGRTLGFEYDDQSKLIAFTDAAGARWTYAWDSEKHVTEARNATGEVVFQVSTDANSRATSVALAGATTSYTYEASRTLVTATPQAPWIYEFNAQGQTTRVTAPDGGSTTWQRDAATGDVTHAVDATGGVHDFTHDAGHRILTYQGPAVNGVRSLWQFQRDTGGRLTKMTPPAGGPTYFEYDAAGWLVAEGVDVTGDGTPEATRYQRAANGDITARIDPMGRTTTYTYLTNDSPAQDSKGLIGKVQPPCLQSGAVCPVILLDYDSAGRAQRLRWPVASDRWASWTFGYSVGGPLTSLTDPLGRAWSFTYDANRSLTRMTTPAGAQTAYSHRPDGKVLTLTDPTGAVTAWGYDTQGRVSSVTDPTNAVTHFEWDAMDRLRAYVDPESRRWEMDYDAMGRLTEERRPGFFVVRSFWDAAGRLTRREMPGGVVETFEHDAAGRLTRSTRNQLFRGASTSDGWEYDWDPRGLVLATRNSIDGPSVLNRELRWTWNAAGELATYTDAAAVVWTVTRDAWGRVTALSPTSGVASTRTYDPWSGWLTSRTVGEIGGVEQYVFNDAGELVRAVESGARTREVEFERDAMGRLVLQRLIENNETRSAELDYDGAGRVRARTNLDGSRTVFSYSRRGELVEEVVFDGFRQRHARLLSYDRSGLPVSLREQDRVTSWEWNFGPSSDPAAGVEVMRTTTGDGSAEHRLLFDADGRIGSVSRNDGTWTALRDFRWAANGAPWIVGSAVTADGTTTESQFVGGPSGIAARLVAGSIAWSRPMQSISDGADSGTWRSLIGGRRHAEIDEGSLVLQAGPLGPVPRAGGQGTGAGLELPDASLLAGVMERRAYASAADEGLARESVDPAFHDPDLGLPDLAAGADFSVPRVSDAIMPALRNDIRNVRDLGSSHLITNGDIESFCADNRPSAMGQPPADCVDIREYPPKPRWRDIAPPLRNPDIDPTGVRLADGEFTLSVTDVTIKGRGLDLSFTRNYDSGNLSGGTLGHGWTTALLDERVMFWGEGDYEASPLKWTTASGHEREVSEDIGKWRTWTDGTGNDIVEIRTLDGVIRRFEESAAWHMTRMTRIGSSRIDIAWNATSEPYWPKPSEIVLRACDADPESGLDPAGCSAADSPILGRFFDFEFVSTGAAGKFHHVRSFRVEVQGQAATRTLAFNYDAATAELLENVTISDGTRTETVARYEYATEGADPCYYPPVLLSIANAERTLVLLEYGRYGEQEHVAVANAYVGFNSAVPVSCNRHRAGPVGTPDGGEKHHFEISTDFIGVPHSASVKVSNAGGNKWRVSTHTFDGKGRAGSVLRPDGATVHFEYDSFGRMLTTWTTDNGGHVGPTQQWVYRGFFSEHASEYRVIPSTFTRCERAMTTCYQADELTGTVWRTRTLHNEMPDDGDNKTTADAEWRAQCDGDGTLQHEFDAAAHPFDAAPCTFTESDGRTLLPGTSETTAGWHTALPMYGGERITTDERLESYLRRWGFWPDPRDFQDSTHGGTGTAQGPWLDPVKETGRSAEHAVTAQGAVAVSSVRPVTVRSYTPSGNLVSIIRPDGSAEHFRYLPARTLGAAPPALSTAADGEYGRLGEREVTGPGRPSGRLSLTRYVYDAWGNTVVEAALSAGSGSSAGWIRTERAFDFQGRLTAETVRGTDDQTRVEARFQNSADGRLEEKLVDTTIDPSSSTRTYALVEYRYTGAGLPHMECAYADVSAESLGSHDCRTANLPTKRVLTYDAFGNATREATLMSRAPEAWRIEEKGFDKLNRLRSVTSHSKPASASDALPTDPENAQATTNYWYDPLGRIIWEQAVGRPAGIVARTIAREYDGHGRLARESECLDANVGSVDLIGDSTAAEVGSAGHPICSRFLNHRQIWYDEFGRVMRVVVEGEKSATAGDMATLSWTETTYDTRDRVLTARSARSDVENTLARNDITHWVESRTGYDLLDRPIHTATSRGDGTFAVQSVEYDGQGRRMTRVDELGNRTEITRNLLGMPTAATRVEVSLSPGVTTNLKTIVTSFEYDALGRPSRIGLPAGDGAGTRSIVRSIDARGLVRAEWSPLGTGGSLGNAYKTTYDYDGLGRKTWEHRHLGPATTWTDEWQDVKYVYDDAARLIEIDVEPESTTGGVHHQVTRYAYDALGRRTTRTLPDNRTEVTGYDDAGRALTTRWTSANGVNDGTMLLTSTYDTASRRTKLVVTTPRTNDVDGHFAGLGEDSLDGTLNKNSHQYWDYDGLGRVVVAYDTNGGTDIDGDGTADVAASDTRRDDVKTTYSYDTLGNVVSEAIGGNAWSAANVVSGYDDAGRRTNVTYPFPAFGGGSPTEIASAWDDLDRLIAETRGATTLASFKYAGPGRLVRQEYVDGSRWQATSSTAWDAAGRRLAGHVVDPAQGDRILFGEEMAYDADDRVTRVVWPHVNVGPTLRHAQEFSYDEAGRLTAFRQGDWDLGTQSRTGTSREQLFELDELGNWRGHTLAPGHAMRNPAVGATNEYTSWPQANAAAHTATNDAVRGFLFERGLDGGHGLRYVHDALGRLVHVRRKESTGGFVTLVSFGYDAAGRLAWRQAWPASGQTLTARVWFAYDGTQVVQEFTHDEVSQVNAVEAEYVWAGSRLLLAKDATNLERVVHADRLGSVVLETRANAGAVEVRGEAAYDPYGRNVTAWTWGDDPLQVTFGFAGARRELFSGVEVDLDGDGAMEKAGLYLMGARWYDPELGRFIEQDPIGESGGLNLYAYVGSSPTMWVDPTGLRPERKEDEFEKAIQSATQKDEIDKHNDAQREEELADRDGEIQGAAAEAAEKAKNEAASTGNAGSQSNGTSTAQTHAQAGAAKPLRGDHRTDEEKKMFNDPDVRASMQHIWKASDPENPDPTERLEVGVTIVKASDDDHAPDAGGPVTNASETDVTSRPLPLVRGGIPVADVHTHPSAGKKGIDEKTGNTYPHLPTGGPTEIDKRSAAERQLPVYVIERKRMTKFDPAQPSAGTTVVLSGKAFRDYMGFTK